MNYLKYNFSWLDFIARFGQLIWKEGKLRQDNDKAPLIYNKESLGMYNVLSHYTIILEFVNCREIVKLS